MPTKDVNVTPSSPSSSSLPHMSGKGSSSGYSAGSMTGFAIAMLMVGVVSECAVMLFVMKRKATAEFGYGKQGNVN